MDDRNKAGQNSEIDSGGKGAGSARAKRLHRDLRRGKPVTIELPSGERITLEGVPRRGKPAVVVTIAPDLTRTPPAV